MACVRRIGVDLLDELAIGDQLELALDDEKRQVVLIALLEDVAALAVFDHFAVTQHLFLVLRRQAVDGDQLPNGVCKLVSSGGHLAG